MRIQVKSFAMIRELFGSSKVELSLPDGTSLQTALAKLSDSFSGLKELLFPDGSFNPSFSVIVNGVKVNPLSLGEFILENNALIIILPPSGGG